MDDLKNIKIRELEMPQGLHRKIMSRVLFLKLKTPFIAVFSILIFNLLVSGWRIFVKAGETEFASSLKAVFDGFELNYDFLSALVTTTLNDLPIGSTVVFLGNFILAIYALRFYKSRKQLIS